MRAVVVSGVNAFSVEEVPDPVPAGGDVVVEVRASGLCGTDVHLVRGDLTPGSYPFTPGHEVAGVIVDGGDGAQATSVGTPVAVHPFVECGFCAPCRAGRPNICLAPRVMGTGGLAGGCSEFVAVPPGKVFALGDLPYSAGVIAEPLACVVHALTLVRIGMSRVLVVGGGVTGALFLDLLRARGTEAITVVELEATKRAAIVDRGAEAAFASVGEAMEHVGGGFDLVVDAVGAPGIFEQAVDAVAIGGEILQFGIPSDQTTATFRPGLLYQKEFRVIGARGLGDDYPAAIDHLRNRDVDWESLAEPLVPLEEFADALRRVETAQVNRAILAP